MIPDQLTFKQALAVFAAVSVWLVLLTMLILMTSQSTLITPALWLFSSATLLLFGLVKRFGVSIQDSLTLHQPQVRWLLLALLIGGIYWWFDHALTVWLWQQDPQISITAWQTANSHYHWLSVLLSTVVLAPVFEELLFRGLLLKALTQRFNFYLAATATAVVFALIHWSWPAFISLFLVGWVYAWLSHRSGSVLPAMLAHCTHNLITYLFYNY